MKKQVRYAFICGLAGIAIFFGVLFAPFVIDHLIRPAAAVLWLLLRLFVLSVDQKYYWYVLIAAAGFFALHRLSRNLEIVETVALPNTNAALQKADIWRSDIQLGAGEIQEQDAVRQGLAKGFVSMYLSRQSSATYPEIYEALKQRQIPLPDHIHAFLFPEAPEEPDGLYPVRILRSIRRAPRRWIRKWTGKAAADYYQAIDETLVFMENTLEMKNDHE